MHVVQARIEPVRAHAGHNWVVIEDDPGWPFPNPALLLPGYLPRYLKRNTLGDGLLALRAICLTFSLSVVAIGVLCAFVSSFTASIWPIGLVLAVAIAVDLVADRVVGGELDCGSDQLLAETYRTRFFLQLGFVEVVPLVGFVLVIMGASLWLYVAAGAYTLLRQWAFLFPTEAVLRREQERLNVGGCGRSLVHVLRQRGTGAARDA